MFETTTYFTLLQCYTINCLMGRGWGGVDFYPFCCSSAVLQPVSYPRWLISKNCCNWASESSQLPSTQKYQEKYIRTAALPACLTQHTMLRHRSPLIAGVFMCKLVGSVVKDGFSNFNSDLLQMNYKLNLELNRGINLQFRVFWCITVWK